MSYVIFKHQILLGKPCYFSFILSFPTSSPLVTQKESLSPYFLLQCWHVCNFQFYVIFFASVLLFVNEGSCYAVNMPPSDCVGDGFSMGWDLGK